MTSVVPSRSSGDGRWATPSADNVSVAGSTASRAVRKGVKGNGMKKLVRATSRYRAPGPSRGQLMSTWGHGSEASSRFVVGGHTVQTHVTAGRTLRVWTCQLSCCSLLCRLQHEYMSKACLTHRVFRTEAPFRSIGHMLRVSHRLHWLRSGGREREADARLRIYTLRPRGSAASL